MAHTCYLLSLDPQFEMGWVYRAESSAAYSGADRWDLFNELEPQPYVPEYSHVLVDQFRFADIPKDVYDQVLNLRSRGDDIGEDEADRLLKPFWGEQHAPDQSCYLIETIMGDALGAAAREPQPFGPGFQDTDLDGIEHMEIWGLRFSSPGEDFVEYRLMRGGTLVKSRRYVGY